jgi:bifunctional N-acetylglutamate synthase/kinase
LNNEQETARVAAALAFLYRIGLVPIVVHGAGLFTGRKSAQVASAAAEVAESMITVEEKRTKLMSAAQEDMKNANAALVEALHREGVEAEPLFEDVFEAVEVSSMNDSSNILNGAIGHVSAVDLDAINGAVKAGKIPVVAALGHLADASYGNGAPLTFSTQEATMALAKVVRPLKVIWLRPEGGFHKLESGKPIHSVDLCREAPSLSPSSSASLVGEPSAEVAIGSASRVPVTVDPISVSSSELESIATKLDISSEDALALSHLASMYGVLADPGATVSVTAPEHLASELFTHKGEGTLVSRGERILSFNSMEGVDQMKIRAIIQDAFGASLPDDYFASLNSNGRKLRAIYVSEGYRGVAVVTEEAGLPGVPYLDKFAVTTDSQGDKLGQVLWRTMVANESPLYWRSKSTNRVNHWYYEQADGCYKSKTGDWTVFWRGLDDGNVMTAIDCALALKPTFDKHVYPKHGSQSMGYVQPSLK